jgi:outer membrane protein with beta-barrel domain
MIFKTGDMENNIGHFFRDKLHQREFALNEAHWAGAEQLLRADEERRRRRFFWWFGATGVLLVMASVAGFFYFSVPEPQKAVATRTAPSEPTAPAGTDYRTDETNLPAGNANIANEKTESPATENRAADGGENAASAAPAGNEKNSDPKAAHLAQNTNSSNVVNPAQISSLPPGTTTVNSHSTIAPEGATTMSMKAPKQRQEYAGPLALLAGATIFPQGQTTPGLHLPGTEGVERRAGISIGAMASQLMLANAPAGGKSIIGFEAGVVIEGRVKNGWFVASGLQYQRRTGSFEGSKMTETRSYRFGLELANEQLQPSSLHYLQLPVKLGWQKRHHLLEGGLSLNYLAGVRGAKGSLERTGDVPPRKEFMAAQKGWIAEDGYKKWHAIATAGYRYRMSGQLSFGLSANYSIGGILEKNYLPPAGNYLLKEDNRFYLSAGVGYFIK